MRFALLLAMPLLGCSAEDGGSIPTDAEANALSSGAAWWSVHTNDAHQVACPHASLCFVGSEVWTVRRYASLARWCFQPLGCAAVTLRNKKEIALSPFDTGQEPAIVTHELGHALGLEHTLDGVMEYPIKTDRFTQAVRAECARAGAC